ncbi:MAG: DUF3830 family protein [Dethiobacteria bacterium]|nr:DUF3830 family protein [Bacillota bacterium]
MKKYLEITIGDVVARAELLENEAPKLCTEIEKAAPLLEGKLNHAKVCDNEVFFQAPFFSDELENMIVPQPGDIAYWIARQTICIWYDETTPLGPANVFARIIPEDRHLFAAEASKVWENQGTHIKMVVKEVGKE